MPDHLHVRRRPHPLSESVSEAGRVVLLAIACFAAWGCGDHRTTVWERNATAEGCADYFLPVSDARYGNACPRPEQVALVKDLTNGNGPLLFCQCPRAEDPPTIDAIKARLREVARDGEPDSYYADKLLRVLKAWEEGRSTAPWADTLDSGGAP